MARTIIDILRKGNLELFHSSIVSWLLDPTGEHRLGAGFLKAFAETVAQRGSTELNDKLNHALPESITAEATSYKSRYDILIHLDGKTFVIENKTKSIGAWPQFEKYDQSKCTLIALGYSDISFSEEVKSKFPVITYKDILEILNSFTLDGNDDFTIFIKHYRSFLHRELSVFDLIKTCYIDNKITLHSKINRLILEAKSYNINDLRFFNLYYLEKFKNYLQAQPDFVGSKWRSSKDEISGVWLAGLPERYHYLPELQELCHKLNAHLWFHLELREGLFTNQLDELAGVIQLRCESHNSNKEFLHEFKSVYQLQDGEVYSSRVNEKAKSFYLVSKAFKKKHLLFANLLGIVQGFMNRLGNFQ